MGLFDWMTVEEAKKADYDEAKYRLNKSRPVGRYNKRTDNTSSVKLAWASTPDGGGVAFPMLFPKPDSEFSTHRYDWDEYGTNPPVSLEMGGSKGTWEDALKRAYAQNEAYEFKTEAEAEDFAAGSWKKGHYFSSPEGKYRENPVELNWVGRQKDLNVKNLGHKIPKKLWKKIMTLKKGLSSEAHPTLYSTVIKGLDEKHGKEIDGYNDEGNRKKLLETLYGYMKGYDSKRQENRYNPDSGGQVGYVMNRKNINKMTGNKSGDTEAFYGTATNRENSNFWFEPDTMVLNPELFYQIKNEDDEIDSNTLLGALVHEDMHAPQMNRHGEKIFGQIGHEDDFTSQDSYSNIIDALFGDKQSMLKETPKGEQGVSYYPFMKEVTSAIRDWIETEKLDANYFKQPYYTKDPKEIDFDKFEEDMEAKKMPEGLGIRWGSVDRLKEKYAK